MKIQAERIDIILAGDVIRLLFVFHYLAHVGASWSGVITEYAE